jgi:hypothetical protein
MRRLETVNRIVTIHRRQHYKSTRTVDFQSTRCMCELSHNALQVQRSTAHCSPVENVEIVEIVLQ